MAQVSGGASTLKILLRQIILFLTLYNVYLTDVDVQGFWRAEFPPPTIFYRNFSFFYFFDVFD